MKSDSLWHYDEFKPVGRDYGSQSEVDVYDASHADFRDIKAESNKVLDTLGIKGGETVIDFGSGTGSFALEAAKRGARVHAVDVSLAMLDQAKAKADQEGVSGIEFHHAGFLTYQHPDGFADAIVTTFAFHHLPDFWKGIALGRICRMLKHGGQFYMHDVVIEESNALENIALFIEKQGKAGGDFLREDAEGHFRDEFSTYDWVIDEMLARAGFHIAHKNSEGGVLGTYLCRKEGESHNADSVKP
ncbi:MAG: class I SAM-dependent methyltransferase [Opitutales bacterium]|nr:class I SAM-dependent methyltransferase [Opitutales bacterium]MCH8539808.1 class I SAM-dependent methyltransferase [Opitutales bacterium]